VATPALSVTGVSKAFPTPEGGEVNALIDVSIEVPEGSFTVLLGPSGCGKTTLLRCIAGLESPDAGQILLRGERIDQVPVWKRRVNTVFQSYALFPHMTVEQNIAFGLQMDRVPKSEITRRVGEALELVQLSDLGRRKPSQLSGGQQQRVALARALAKEPTVLLLDEPLSALDLKLRRGMQSELKRLQRQTSITFILVTHDQGEAMAMGDQVAVFNSGRIVQLGTPEDVYNEPRTAFVADFIGEANLVTARRDQGLIVLDGLGAVEESAIVDTGQSGTAGIDARQVILAVRPENISLEDEPDGPAVVTDVTFTGGDIHVDVELGPNQLTVRLPSHGVKAPRVGDRVRPRFLAGSIRVMADE
jgi:spermidine/putrescine transport system ATP-binding protein